MCRFECKPVGDAKLALAKAPPAKSSAVSPFIFVPSSARLLNPLVVITSCRLWFVLEVQRLWQVVGFGGLGALAAMASRICERQLQSAADVGGAEAVLALFKRMPESVRGDRQVVAVACQLGGGRAFEAAAEALHRDRSFLLQLARAGSWEALLHAAVELRCDGAFVVALAKEAGDWRALRCCDASLWARSEFVARAVAMHWETLQYAAPCVAVNRAIALKAVRRSGYALRHVHESLRQDREVVLAAVTRCWTALQFAHESLRADGDIVAAAMAQSPQARAFAAESWQREHEDAVDRDAKVHD